MSASEAVSDQEAEIRRLLGPIYDRSKRLCRMLADRHTPEDDEAAGVFAAVLYKLANSEADKAHLVRLLERAVALSPSPAVTEGSR